jgi:hypothetical protein
VVRRLILAVLILLLFLGCTTTGGGKSPSWLDHPYDRQFDQQHYLSAVGSGSTREQAVDAARAGLAQIFSSTVHSMTEVTTLSTSTRDPGGEQAFTHATEMLEIGRVTAQVDSIIASEVVNVHVDSLGRTHARVVMDRKKSAALLSAQVDELKRMRAAQRSRRVGESTSLGQYVMLLQELSLAREEQALSDQVQVLLGKPLSQVVLPLEQELGRLAAQIGVFVTVDGPEESASSVQAAFEQALQQLGFSVGRSDGQYRLEAEYQVEDVVMEQSPYHYARYALSARLLDEKRVYLSFEETSREAAMSRTEANARALRAATTDGVGMFVTRLLQKLADEY